MYQHLGTLNVLDQYGKLIATFTSQETLDNYLYVCKEFDKMAEHIVDLEDALENY